MIREINIKNYVSLKPLFKYPGGKASEYKYLKSIFPVFDFFIEPFLGGGAFYWAIDTEEMLINDCSEELVSIYRYTQDQDKDFICYLSEIGEIWDRKNEAVHDVMFLLFDSLDPLNDVVLEKVSTKIFDGFVRLKKDPCKLKLFLSNSISLKLKSLDRVGGEVTNLDDNSLGVLGAAVYTYFRDIYNHIEYKDDPQLKTVLYLFLREYAYSSMFRYNAKGDFNVPFGGNSYARKSFLSRLEQIQDQRVVEKLNRTKICNDDFSKCMIDVEGAFMFLDPPYDTDFSAYNASLFGRDEHLRLRDHLLGLKKTKWMLVVKSTDFIEKIYMNNDLFILRFDKLYSVNFKNRNNRSVEHLVVTNYSVTEI